MSQVRPKAEKVGEIAAKAVVQLLFSTGKSFTADGLREKAPGILSAGGTRRSASCGGTEQCGTHYRATVLQPAVGPCRPSAPSH